MGCLNSGKQGPGQRGVLIPETRIVTVGYSDFGEQGLGRDGRVFWFWVPGNGMVAVTILGNRDRNDRMSGFGGTGPLLV